MFVYLKSDGLRGRLLRHLGDNYLATKQQQLLQRLGRLAGAICFTLRSVSVQVTSISQKGTCVHN